MKNFTVQNLKIEGDSSYTDYGTHRSREVVLSGTLSDGSKVEVKIMVGRDREPSQLPDWKDRSKSFKFELTEEI